MKYVRAVNTARGRILGARIGVADRWWLRFRGLGGRAGLAPGEGLLLRPCRAVHMLGMKFPLDVAFLDAGNKVVARYHRLSPGARTRWHRSALAALELPSGTLEETGTMEGDLVEYQEETSR
jgi:uncharacterized membrane protein (UPF0127 family)